jgi:hypothetical protein
MYRNKFNSSIMESDSKSTVRCTDLESVDEIIKKNINKSPIKSWSKIDKSAKYKLLVDYATAYKEEKSLSDVKYNSLIAFFKDCMDKKKLYRVKDVVYDSGENVIKDIPHLMFNTHANTYTLRNSEKYISATKNLGPRKRTIRNTLSESSSTVDSTLIDGESIDDT